MGANDRGYDSEEIQVNLVTYVDLDQDKHDADDLAGQGVDDIDWSYIDWATVEVVYPDGHREWRHFVGPFNDLEDFYEGFLDWLETGRTP